MVGLDLMRLDRFDEDDRPAGGKAVGDEPADLNDTVKAGCRLGLRRRHRQPLKMTFRQGRLTASGK